MWYIGITNTTYMYRLVPVTMWGIATMSAEWWVAPCHATWHRESISPAWKLFNRGSRDQEDLHGIMMCTEARGCARDQENMHGSRKLYTGSGGCARDQEDVHGIRRIYMESWGCARKQDDVHGSRRMSTGSGWCEIIENILAMLLCQVDSIHAEKTSAIYPKITLFFKDLRMYSIAGCLLAACFICTRPAPAGSLVS